MSFCDNLRKARLCAGLTQQQVADSLGVTKSTYCCYETGKRQPDLVKLRRLAQLLCTTADDLLDLSNGNNECIVTQTEYDQIKTFRSLDPHGQHLVRLVLKEESMRIHTHAPQSDSNDPS